MHQKVFKNIRKTITLCRFSSLGIGITKLHCIAMASIRSVKRQHLNSHFFRIPILLAFFSAKSANPTVFRMRILLAFFSAKSANSAVFRIPILLVTEIFLCEAYRFQKTSQTSDAQKNTPFVVVFLHCGDFAADSCFY